MRSQPLHQPNDDTDAANAAGCANLVIAVACQQGCTRGRTNGAPADKAAANANAAAETAVAHATSAVQGQG